MGPVNAWGYHTDRLGARMDRPTLVNMNSSCGDGRVHLAFKVFATDEGRRRLDDELPEPFLDFVSPFARGVLGRVSPLPALAAQDAYEAAYGVRLPFGDGHYFGQCWSA